VESDKARDINAKLKLDVNNTDGILLTEEHVVECHSPLKDPELVRLYENEYVLIAGYFDSLNVAINYGYKKAIDVSELAALFPEAVPFDPYNFPED
jgi:hypothetical protein